VSLLGLLPLLVLVFPSGRLPSRRWRPALWVVAGGLVLYLGLYVLQPGPLGDGLPANPLGVGWAERLMGRIGPVLFLLFGLFVVLVLGSLVLRFRRSRGDERQQLKWLTYAAALLVLFPPTLGGVLERIDPWVLGAVAFAPAVSTVPAAIGVAVLKYRLYDIDRVINRTLVYGLLTTLLVGIYAAGVFVLGHLLNPVSGDSALAVAASTLAVAALFQPTPAPAPSCRRSAVQPPPLRRGQEHRGLQRPAPERGRSGHPGRRAACGDRPDDAANPIIAVASSIGPSNARRETTRKPTQARQRLDPLHDIYGPAAPSRPITADRLQVWLSVGHRD
jgi:hypothetical protein